MLRAKTIQPCKYRVKSAQSHGFVRLTWTIPPQKRPPNYITRTNMYSPCYFTRGCVYRYIYTHCHWFIHLFTYSFINLFIYSFIYTCTNSISKATQHHPAGLSLKIFVPWQAEEWPAAVEASDVVTLPHRDGCVEGLSASQVKTDGSGYGDARSFAASGACRRVGHGEVASVMPWCQACQAQLYRYQVV